MNETLEQEAIRDQREALEREQRAREAQSPATGEERKGLLPDWTPGGWALATWTALVLAAVITGEVWNVVSPQPPDSMVSTGAIGTFTFLAGLVIWLVGLLLGYLLWQWVGAFLDYRDLRAVERERAASKPEARP